MPSVHPLTALNSAPCAAFSASKSQAALFLKGREVACPPLFRRFQFLTLRGAERRVEVAVLPTAAATTFFRSGVHRLLKTEMA